MSAAVPTSGFQGLPNADVNLVSDFLSPRASYLTSTGINLDGGLCLAV